MMVTLGSWITTEQQTTESIFGADREPMWPLGLSLPTFAPSLSTLGDECV